MSEVYLSREGYEKLQVELKELKETERPAVRQALQRAREFGDLSENAEYSAAKERLLFLEQRIGKLEETLSRARLLENEAIPEDKVYIGATVELEDLAKARQLTYTLVAPEEADFEAGKISHGFADRQRVARARSRRKKSKLKCPLANCTTRLSRSRAERKYPVYLATPGKACASPGVSRFEFALSPFLDILKKLLYLCKSMN